MDDGENIQKPALAPDSQINHPAAMAERIDRNAELLHRLNYTLARRSHRLAVLTALLILAYTTITAVQAYVLYQSYRETQNSFIASERPYVSLGDRNGRIAEFRQSTDGKAALIVYFFNAGRTPALNWIANIWSSLPGRKKGPMRRIERFRDPATGVMHTVPGPNIPGMATHIEYLPTKWMPTEAELKAIRTGKKFEIGGTFEYCDQFGNYRCQGFWASYRPPPINDFVQFAAPSCSPSPPAPSAAAGGSSMIALPRCQKPGEK